MPSLMPTDKLASIGFRIGLVVFVLLTFTGLGIYWGSSLESAKWRKKLLNEREISSQIIYKKDGETEQCRAQVDEINRLHAELSERVAQDALADRNAREKASKEAFERARETDKKNALVIAALKDIKDGIEKGQFEPCTGTVADGQFLGLLNEAIEANRVGDP